MRLLGGIVASLVVFVLLRAFVVQTFRVSSGSMEPTLLAGDLVVANRLAFGSMSPAAVIDVPGYSEPARGDVVVVDPPHEDFLLVGRIVGLPGDTLAMQDALLIVNGRVAHEPYLPPEAVGGDDLHPWMLWQTDYLIEGVDPSYYQPTRDNWGPLLLPEGAHFLLGDNRARSLDSRYWGPLDRWRVLARLERIYFSSPQDRYGPRFSFWWGRLPWVRWERVGKSLRLGATWESGHE